MTTEMTPGKNRDRDNAAESWESGLPPDLVEAIKKHGDAVWRRIAPMPVRIFLDAETPIPATTASDLTPKQWMEAWAKEWQRANRAEAALDEIREVLNGKA